MSAGSVHPKIAVALATVEDLPAPTRRRPDAERRASRIAARRAIRSIVGRDVIVDLRRRVNRPPLARVRDGCSSPIALSLTHCDGRTAAIAAISGAKVGIDLERLVETPGSHERYFLTDRERRATSSWPAAVLWTLKEAVWKALALDPSVGLQELELDIDDAGTMRGAEVRGVRYHGTASVSSPWPGYVMATVHLRDGR